VSEPDRRVVTKVVQNPRRVTTKVIPPRQVVVTRVTAQQGPAGPGRRKVCVDIGGGEASEFVIEHGWGTRDVHVSVTLNRPPYPDVVCRRERPDVNTVVVRLGVVAAPGQYRVLISEA
jgi:hypothetical protein